MKKYISKALSIILAGGFAACSSHQDTMQDLEKLPDNSAHTCVLNMNITKSGFDDETETRSASGWQNGDVVYLIFETSDGTSYGDAVYNNGTWNLTYFGSLLTGSPANCKAFYVENPGSEMGSVIMLNSGSCVYEDQSASYVFEGGNLSVTATLSPKTGRIRFEGAENTNFKLYGISCYTALDTSNGNFTLTSDMISTSVSGSSTPYIYGLFSDSKEPRVIVIYTESAFTKQFNNTIFNAGESGYVTLPTTSAHNGWRNNAIFNINGVDLTMIPVEYENGNFLLAETETTEEFYHAVTNEGESSLYPKSNLVYSNWQTFCTTLYKEYRIDFRMPSREEWQFAFKGGNKSQGFTYSGSNNIYDVAWFNGNSDGEKHLVKQLLPNELGFYDMSGNVMEYTSYGAYYGYGGWFDGSSSYCKVNESYNNYQYSGLRLALSND